MLLKVVHSRIARSRSVSVVAMVATAQVGCAGICREPTMCEAAPRAVCGCGETHLGGRPPGRVKGGLNAGFVWGSSLVVNPVVGDPGYGVLLMYGNASYIRWCNDAVNPLVGDVIGVTEVRKLQFCCAIWSAGAGG